MKAVNIQTNKHALEVQEELKKLSIIPDDSRLNNYRQLEGGAETTIFEISFQNHSKKYIQRVFNKFIHRGAEFEYYVQKILFENGINVPKPFLLKLTPNIQGSPYFIMEKIEGIRLDQVSMKNPDQSMQLLEKFLQELHKIHSIDPKLFPQIPSPDIQENPFAPIDQLLTTCKEVVKEFEKDLSELKPVIDWLEYNKTNNPCKELVVNHGDYHPANIIVQEDQEFNILDWANIQINDFRLDLGATAVFISSGVKMNVVPLIISTYEQISGKKVENLPFFMILANIFTLIRIYSGINNPTITNETEDTMNSFKLTKFLYLYLLEFVKEICNIELLQIKKYFDVID